MALANWSKSLRKMSSGQIKTAGILVIGDELLNGSVIDSNSPHITKGLHRLGIKVKKISVIGDEVDDISNEVKIFSNLYNYVITTGGIGPTHDDVTFEGIAKAFNVPLIPNPQLQALCCKFYQTQDVSHPGMKLALVPATAKLTFAEQTNYPNVSVENVYIFPGIPELFLRSFTHLSAKLFKSEDTFHTKAIYVNLTEDKIAEELSKLATEFPDVQVGSYPKLSHELYKVKITLQSTSEESATAACGQLLGRFPKSAVVNIEH